MPDFRGERWTQDKASFSGSKGQPIAAADVARLGLQVVRCELGKGVSFNPALVHAGYNSGFQALNLAALFGCTRIILLGYDMQNTGGKQHFHGNHPDKLNRASPFGLFRAAYHDAAPQLAAAGIQVINCTRETALMAFPIAALEDVL